MHEQVSTTDFVAVAMNEFVVPILSADGESTTQTTNDSDAVHVVARAFFGCRYCHFQSGLRAVATGNHNKHARTCSRYVAEHKCAQCGVTFGDQTGTTTQCSICRRDVHTAARCSNHQGNCNYCVRWISSPLIKAIAPGHLNFDNTRIIKDLIRSHCNHMGLPQLPASADRRMLWCHAFKDQTVPIPQELPPEKTALDNVVLTRFTTDRQDDWNTFVGKDPHPIYRIFMKNSSPWPDGAIITSHRLNAEQTLKQLKQNLKDANLPEVYADHVQADPTTKTVTYGKIVEAIVHRECPRCFSTKLKPLASTDGPALWVKTVPTEDVPEVHSIL